MWLQAIQVHKHQQKDSINFLKLNFCTPVEVQLNYRILTLFPLEFSPAVESYLPWCSHVELSKHTCI